MALVCKNCSNQTELMLCQNCASLSCRTCIDEIEIPRYFCNECEMERPGESCGTCGSLCTIVSTETVIQCPICGDRNLGDPHALLINLPKEYYDTLALIKEVQNDISKLNELLSKMIGQVQYARFLGLYGFPSIERKLKFLATLLTELNDEAIQLLDRVKKESYSELRSVNYFKDVKIDLYRVAYFKVKSVRERVGIYQSIIQSYIKTVKMKFRMFISDFELLDYHQRSYLKIRNILPTNERYVVAVIPNISVGGSIFGRTMKDVSLIFRERDLLMMSTSHIDPLKSRILVDYTDIISVEIVRNNIKGVRLQLRTLLGNYDLRGSKSELKVIKTYFKMIEMEPQHFAVPSDKDIETLHKMLPNISRLDREIDSFLQIIHTRIFSVDSTRESERRMTQLEAQRVLEDISQQMIVLNNLVREEKIGAQQYREEFNRLKRKEQELSLLLNRGRRDRQDLSSIGRQKGIHFNITYNENNEESEEGEEPHPYSPDFFRSRAATSVFDEFDDLDDFHL